MYNIQNEWFNSCVNVNSLKYVKKFNNPFKYKCGTLSYMCVSIYINKCNMEHLNNGFNKFNVNDSTHVELLIVQEMWKKSLNHSNMIANYWISCVLV